jgi:hypothetical protein
MVDGDDVDDAKQVEEDLELGGSVVFERAQAADAKYPYQGESDA